MLSHQSEASLRAARGGGLAAYVVCFGLVPLVLLILGIPRAAVSLYSNVHTEATSRSPESCFVAGTKVSTVEGTRAIESLRTGDLVLSRDEATGAVAPARITRTFVREVTSLVEVRIEDSSGAIDVILATPDHPFWTLDRGWVGASALVPIEPLRGARDRPLFVVSVTPVPLRARVYNMEVEGAHTYFVGAHQTWVHNACDFLGYKPLTQSPVSGAPGTTLGSPS